jgi:hypothetical protein
MVGVGVHLWDVVALHAVTDGQGVEAEYSRQHAGGLLVADGDVHPDESVIATEQGVELFDRALLNARSGHQAKVHSARILSGRGEPVQAPPHRSAGGRPIAERGAGLLELGGDGRDVHAGRPREAAGLAAAGVAVCRHSVRRLWVPHGGFHSTSQARTPRRRNRRPAAPRSGRTLARRSLGVWRSEPCRPRACAWRSSPRAARRCWAATACRPCGGLALATVPCLGM